MPGLDASRTLIMMTIKEYRSIFISALSPVYDSIEAENIFYLILEEFRKLKRVDIALQPELSFSGDEVSNWATVLDKLKSDIPIQYVLGKAHFYGLQFDVSPDVLIPRPETEELVQWILADSEFSANKNILDIGTGSGCIAISIAKNLRDSAVSAIDVSEKAIAIAEENAANNKVSVMFINCDILKADRLPQTYDLIVSNPPYVRHLEKHEIKKNVLDNEPHLALFVSDEDALVFYRKIATLAFDYLSLDGSLYFEINQYLGDETVNLLRNLGFKSVELRKDIYGNDRMIRARR